VFLFVPLVFRSRSVTAKLCFAEGQFFVRVARI